MKIKHFEKELAIEENLLLGLTKMSKVASGQSKATTLKQIENTEKKIEFIKDELNKLRKVDSSLTNLSSSTLMEFNAEKRNSIEDAKPAKPYDVAGHSFRFQEFPSPVACSQCKDSLMSGMECFSNLFLIFRLWTMFA